MRFVISHTAWNRVSIQTSLLKFCVPNTASKSMDVNLKSRRKKGGTRILRLRLDDMAKMRGVTARNNMCCNRAIFTERSNWPLRISPSAPFAGRNLATFPQLNGSNPSQASRPNYGQMQQFKRLVSGRWVCILCSSQSFEGGHCMECLRHYTFRRRGGTGPREPVVRPSQWSATFSFTTKILPNTFTIPISAPAFISILTASVAVLTKATIPPTSTGSTRPCGADSLLQTTSFTLRQRF